MCNKQLKVHIQTIGIMGQQSRKQLRLKNLKNLGEVSKHLGRGPQTWNKGLIFLITRLTHKARTHNSTSKIDRLQAENYRSSKLIEELEQKRPGLGGKHGKKAKENAVF